jgi:hypothetical protein
VASLSSTPKEGLCQAAINKVSDHTRFLECCAVSAGITVTNIWRTAIFMAKQSDNFSHAEKYGIVQVRITGVVSHLEWEW